MRRLPHAELAVVSECGYVTNAERREEFLRALVSFLSGYRHHLRVDAFRLPSSKGRDMDFELGPALLAGLIAGTIMEGPVYMQKAMGLPVKQNIFRTWGQNLLGIPHSIGGASAAF